MGLIPAALLLPACLPAYCLSQMSSSGLMALQACHELVGALSYSDAEPLSEAPEPLKVHFGAQQAYTWSLVTSAVETASSKLWTREEPALGKTVLICSVQRKVVFL